MNYTGGAAGMALSSLPPSKRISRAMDQVAKIHPQAPKHFKNAVTLSWDKTPYSNDAFVVWEFTPDADRLYRSLLEPQGSLYFSGEHCSQITAWMAGAIESARSVVKKIHLRANERTSRDTPRSSWNEA